MPGLGQGLVPLLRPTLSRTLSMHHEEEASSWPNRGYFAYVQAPATPHEPLSLNCPQDIEISLPDDVLTACGQLPRPQDQPKQQQSATEEGTDVEGDGNEDSPGPLEVIPSVDKREELPPLPPLPPLDVLPTLPVETIFQRTIPSVTPSVTTMPPIKKITPTPVPIAPPAAPPTALPTAAAATSRKRPAAVPTVVAPTSTVSKTAAPPARKKRRGGQRAGTYQCMVNGELYDCPFHYDMVPKSLILSLLTR